MEKWEKIKIIVGLSGLLALFSPAIILSLYLVFNKPMHYFASRLLTEYNQSTRLITNPSGVELGDK